jgi:hypothetical protein
MTPFVLESVGRRSRSERHSIETGDIAGLGLNATDLFGEPYLQ